MKQFYFRKSSRRLLTAFIVTLLAGTMTASAETKTANFNNGLPDGWSIVGDIYNDSDRARSGKGLWTYSKSDTENYVVTEPVEGTFEFYARAYNKNTASTVIIYEYTSAGLGNQLYTTGSLRTSSTPTWSKFSFKIDKGTQLAIALNYACIDDVTYTPYVPTTSASLSIDDFASGSSYDFGGVAVSAGTTKTFKLKNKGLAALTISSIAVTGGYTITEGASLTTIAAEGSADVTIATPAADATGALTIASNDANSPYVINLSSTYKVPAPMMGLDIQNVNFGWVTANASQVVTVSNTGDGELVANITSSNTDFTISPASVTVAPGTTGTFTITFNYDATAYGMHSATIYATPNIGTRQLIEVSARVANPNVWSEHFEDNKLPAGWEAGESWSFADGMAKSTYKCERGNYLQTPPLTVSGTSDKLTFDYVATGDNVCIAVQKSMNGGEWENFNTSPKLNTAFMSTGTSGTATITGLEAGTYQFRFLNDDYNLDNFEGFQLDNNAPMLLVEPSTDADFGEKVTAQPENLIYTIKNHGTGTLTGTITSSNTSHFTVSKASFSLTAGESTTFEVALVFDTNYGEKSADITIHPTNEGLTDVVIKAKATTKDPNIWEEDFEEGKVPEGWVANSWVVTKSNYKNNGTYMLAAGTSTNTAYSPRLYAEKDQVLEFDVAGVDETDFLTVKWASSRDAADSGWTLAGEYQTEGRQSFTAPATGYYFLSFQGKFTSVDNFVGFKPAPQDHDVAITAQDVPAIGYQYNNFTASVTVKEMAGKEESLTVKFFIGTKQYGESVVKTVAANATETIAVTFTPEEPVSGKAYFTITGTDINMTSTETDVAINAATVWKDTETNEVKEDFYPALVIQYTLAQGWNSICLPHGVDLSDFDSEGLTFFSFTGYQNGALKFSKETSTMIYAATPYLVYSTKAATINFKFTEISIISYYIGDENTRTTKNGAIFQGTYTPMAAGTLTGKYGVIPTTGKIVKGDASTTMKGFRAYFELPAGTTAPTISIDDSTTGIGSIDNGQWTMDNSEVYNLNGQKVQNAQKGLYIVNGRKVVIK